MITNGSHGEWLLVGLLVLLYMRTGLKTMTEIVKICKKHGELTYEQVHKDKDGFRCAECRREHARISRLKYRDARNAKAKEWHNNNKERYRATRMSNKHKYTENLTDSYVRANLIRVGYDKDQITPEMLVIKKAMIKIHRLKKAAKNDS